MVETGNPYRDNVSRLITWGHWFSFFNIILAMLISTRYLGAISWPSTTLGVTYLVISWIGHFSFLSFVTYLLTIFPLSFILPREKPLRFISSIIATLALVLLLIDTQVFQLFKFHLNGQVWQLLLDQAQTEEGSIWSIIFVAVPAIFLLQLLLSAYVWRKINKRKRRQYGNQVGLALLVCFILTHLVNSWADATLYQPITMQRANFPLSYPMTARSFLAKHGWLDLEQYEKKAEDQGSAEHRLLYPLRPLSVSAPSDHKNLLVVVVDSLRADMLNNINMPNLQRYADNHFNFRQHMSGGNDEAMGMFSLFYGLPGHYYGDIRADKLPPVLFDEMLRQDYQFGLFGALEDAKQYRQSLLAGLRKQVFVSRQTDDRRLIDDWQQWLGTRTADRPWFSLVYLSSPGDYQVPASIKGPFQPELTRFNPATAYRPENLQKLENRYKNAVFYTDQLLEQMLTQLQLQGLDDQTIVVITSNHGQEFNETQSNSWGYGSNYSTYQVQVPLVLAWPGAEPAPQAQASSHLDLVPTLMKNMLGVRNPYRDYSTGSNLFEASTRTWLLAGDQNDFAIYQGNTITQFNKQGDFELLDRDTYRPIKHGTPDMGTLIQVMNELNRFYRAP
ncbi:DUF3413 domain-containing protein [Aeromonas caviae]|uniref:DUF3413 domain-containing protein n=1 Tax=Aeromonas caviae TaxID=648 RepID=UPI0029DABAB3|nr:DUF3413 domain-containing protein [Aeromonas caviae]MDX7770755.1 DUF3413 domain-containing protein [Aeromonas caviae]MDX7849544.1 DUF3413 domain-containing protein [Aeromonas caviae]